MIRGKVTEEGSGKPVAGARVWFVGAGRRRGDRWLERPPWTTAAGWLVPARGPPTPGYLVVLGPSDDYVFREIGQRMVREGQPGGRRVYAHAFIASTRSPAATAWKSASPPPGHDRAGPGHRAGWPAGPAARMISRVFLQTVAQRLAVLALLATTGQVRDGRFEIHGLDPDAEVPVYFLEPKSKLGATVHLSGKSATGGPVTVRLEPCGTATARLVDPGGKPVAGFRGSSLIAMVVTPGAALGRARTSDGQLAADEACLAAIDPINYGNGPVSDAEGRIALPALIPGATYRVSTRLRRGAGPGSARNSPSSPARPSTWATSGSRSRSA